MTSAKVQTCMVIGDPVEHSLSPIIHNAGYKALGIDNEYKFISKNVSLEDLKDFVALVRSANIRGVSLTLPHKEKIQPFLDEIDETALKIGAVNTIVNNNGVLKGYNTDWIGAIEPLESITDVKGKNTAVLGAGGASKAFVYGLVNAGCEVTIYNRTLEKAKSEAQQFGCKYESLENQSKIADADIICNATSVGLGNTKEIVIDPDLISNKHIVFDAIYSPLETRLLREAKKRGASIIYGSEMLLHQGCAQFKLFTDLDAPENSMRQALTEYLSEK